MDITSNYSGLYAQLFGKNKAETTPSLGTLLSENADAVTPDQAAENAYSLNLSPAARQYMNAAASLGGNNDYFSLTADQQTAIKDILAKYKDAPFTQETFGKIQADLKQAGLSPEQLSLQDKIHSFNAVDVLVKALNGDFTDPVTQASKDDAVATTKTNNYMEQIIKQWKDLQEEDKETASAS